MVGGAVLLARGAYGGRAKVLRGGRDPWVGLAGVAEALQEGEWELIYRGGVNTQGPWRVRYRHKSPEQSQRYREGACKPAGHRACLSTRRTV